MNNKIRILFLIQYGNLGGGINKTLATQMKNMDREFFSFHVLCTEKGPIIDYFTPLVDEIVVMPVPGSILYRRREEVSYAFFRVLFDFLRLIPFFLKSSWYVKNKNIDVIHGNNLKTNFFGIVLSKICRIPVICHIRSATPLGKMGRFYEWGATSIISVSHEAQRLSFGDSRNSKHLIIYNGRDLTEFSPKPEQESMAIRQEFGVRENELIVAIVGDIIRWKDHITFLKAAQKVLACYQDVKFLIVGDANYESPEYLEYLKEFTIQMSISDKVVFTGYRSDMDRVYSIIDVLVSSSWYEPLGGVLLEAMACHIPVVGTDAGGTPEIISDGQTGFLVPVSDDSTMATAILKLLESPMLREQMGNAGRERAAQLFDINKYVQEMQHEYERVANK